MDIISSNNKPCPSLACGSRALKLVRVSESSWSVQCLGCGLSGPHNADWIVAVARWNVLPRVEDFAWTPAADDTPPAWETIFGEFGDGAIAAGFIDPRGTWFRFETVYESAAPVRWFRPPAPNGDADRIGDLVKRRSRSLEGKSDD